LKFDFSHPLGSPGNDFRFSGTGHNMPIKLLPLYAMVLFPFQAVVWLQGLPEGIGRWDGVVPL